MSLAIHHDPQAQQFIAELSGQRAVLAFRQERGVMSIEHIGIPAPISGQGVAASLMGRALAHARAQGWHVDPVCAYARNFMLQHPEYADLLPTPSAAATPRAAPDAASDDARRRHESAQLDEALDESFPASDPPAGGGDY